MTCVFGALLLMAIAASACGETPKTSADVVEVKCSPQTLADGLECYVVELKVAKGWCVYANVAGSLNDPKRPAAHVNATTIVEFLIDGKKASVHNIHYPPGVLKKTADGGEYRAYEGDVSFSAWLVFDETMNAAVSVRVRVMATDGTTRLQESIVTGR